MDHSASTFLPTYCIACQCFDIASSLLEASLFLLPLYWNRLRYIQLFGNKVSWKGNVSFYELGKCMDYSQLFGADRNKHALISKRCLFY